ncbi:MAG: TRAP transporter fused permease subunit, partial [Pseudomonadota bacterium]
MTDTEGQSQKPSSVDDNATQALDHSQWLVRIGFLLCAAYAAWHLYVLNIAPLETWTFRILHIAGALILGFGMSAALSVRPIPETTPPKVAVVLGGVALVATIVALGSLSAAVITMEPGAQAPPEWTLLFFGWTLAGGTLLAVLTGWLYPARVGQVPLSDIALIVATVVSCGFILFSLDTLSLRLRAGTPFADGNNGWAAFVIVVLIAELTRRLAGMALVVIAVIFIAYAFLGPWMPGFLEHRGYEAKRFFTYIFTDNGVLGPTTAVSSTYIILFIVFAAFLQSSKVGDYFVNFAFAAAGRARGGPAKVSVLASGLMGMINGTSAGNVVSTGSLTIPLMKKVGYRPQSAGAIEAAASTGGQIMPPIMGAGAFIMAEITGIPYTELVVAALIPAILYFASIYFMVDFEASRTGMRGMRKDELPKL